MNLFKTNKSLCVSGPRPVKYDYSGERLDKLNAVLFSEIAGLIQVGYNKIYFGAAPGFDILCAKAVLRLIEETGLKNIELICALPYEKFSVSEHFDDYWREQYDAVIPYCTVVNVGKAADYFQGCYKRRNYYLIDNSDTLLCLYSGKPGGTGQTHAYGVWKGRHIINIYEKVEN